MPTRLEHLTMKTMEKVSASISLDKSYILKGIAILAVVWIHYSSYIQGAFTTSKYQLFFVALDQFSRLCVPMFILLSGYGLALRYKTEQPNWWAFFKTRVLKLIPLYVLWSLVSYYLFSVVPAWNNTSSHEALWYQLLTGSADYQLYFVVLIFQLYAVFPFFLRIVKRFPHSTLLFCFVFQLLLFVYYKSQEVPGQSNFDGYQYTYFMSWIGYFVLGMWLALQKLPAKLIKLFLPLTLISFTAAVWNSWYAIHQKGTDPLLAMKFTRWQVTAYASFLALWISTTSVFQTLQLKTVDWVQKVLKILGKDSYLIFLSHTIGLRIFFYTERGFISLPLAIIILCTWLATIAFSKKVEQFMAR